MNTYLSCKIIKPLLNILLMDEKNINNKTLSQYHTNVKTDYRDKLDKSEIHQKQKHIEHNSYNNKNNFFRIISNQCQPITNVDEFDL
jgi:hypothetical protein